MSDFNPVNPETTWLDKLLWFVTQWKVIFTFFGLVILILAAAGVLPIPALQNSTLLRVTLLVGIPMAILSLPLAVHVVNRLYEPDYEILYRVNAADSEIPIVPYYVGRKKLNDLGLERGNKQVFRTPSGHLAHIVREYDQEDNKAVSNWMDEVSDVEMLEKQKKIDENRLEKQKWAQFGREVRASLPTFLQQVKEEHLEDVDARIQELTATEPDKAARKMREGYGKFESEEDDDEEDGQILEEDEKDESGS